MLNAALFYTLAILVCLLWAAIQLLGLGGVQSHALVIIAVLFLVLGFIEHPKKKK